MFHRNAVAIMPALHRRMACVTQHAGNRSDAPEPLDDCRMGFHIPSVQRRCTASQLENVRAVPQRAVMADGESIGSRLRLLKERSGRSIRAIARDMGAAYGSSVQRY